MEWQPIETAPKDGRYILTYRDSGIHIQRWRNRRDDSGGFWDEWHVPTRNLRIQPIAWMPLPPPPVFAATASAPTTDGPR